MDLNEILVDMKSISVSIVRTTMKDVVIDEDDKHQRVEVRLAKPYLHINCLLYCININQFVAGCDYVDKNRLVYHATDCNTIALVTPKLDQFNPPDKVTMFNKPYKEG